jgi:methyltransferase-like protein 23
LNSLFPYTLSRQKVFDLELYLPDPGEVRSRYENELAAGIIKPFPFWTRIWPSALAMAVFIEKGLQYVSGKQILELGAGLAIPSFIASRYAKKVLASDHSEDAVWLMRKNIEELKLEHTRAEQMDWNDLPDDIDADTVLMSDVNYFPQDFDPLVRIIHKFLDAGSTIILSTPGRLAGKSFIAFLVPYIAYRETMDISGTEILIAVLIKKDRVS